MLEAMAQKLPVAFHEAPIDAGFILGSGWGDALPVDEVLARVPYSELEGYGASTIKGHAGELLLVSLRGKRVAVFSGRRHFYEGCTLEQLVYPVELLRCLNVNVLLITNAAGGLNVAFNPGDLMVLSDHINVTVVNPLRGPHRPEWGPRFPDMTSVYDIELSDRLFNLAKDHIHRGIYVYAVGPSFETPAEVRFYKQMGGDAVGMSTVPEAVLAHAIGMRVVGLSCISNAAAGLSEGPLSHEEVMLESQRAKPRMSALLADFIATL
ncbi:MAG: purine-nucleoside phosphorylase [bacterium]|nr:purine-nucleoside phosphorylase [bacterium]MDO5462785.1 purine-nucleoside phosphorylase [bacterium]